jgi:hypothetical protein
MTITDRLAVSVSLRERVNKHNRNYIHFLFIAIFTFDFDHPCSSYSLSDMLQLYVDILLRRGAVQYIFIAQLSKLNWRQ